MLLVFDHLASPLRQLELFLERRRCWGLLFSFFTSIFSSFPISLPSLSFFFSFPPSFGLLKWIELGNVTSWFLLIGSLYKEGNLFVVLDFFNFMIHA